MPNRILKESICTSDSLAQLSWFDQCLFFRLIVLADDYGRFDGRPAIIKGRGFPLNSVTDKQIADSLSHLATAGIVDLYDVGGKPYLRLETWEQHQRVRESKPKYPAPEENCSSRQFAASCGELPRVAAGIQSESQSESQSQSEVGSTNVLPCPPGDCRADVESAMAAWNTLPLKPIKMVSAGSSRETMLKARLKECGIDTFREAIEHVRESPFLLGQNSRGWVATFDWIIKPSNFQKVLEGNYSARKASGGGNPFADLVKEGVFGD